MFEDKIIELSKNSAVQIFFDMDGVIAEFKAEERELLLSNSPQFFLNSRPIFTTLAIIEKLSNVENVGISILSNCYFKEQKQDKISWLKKYAPFIKHENINIIVLSDETYTKETKAFIKGNYIKRLTENVDTRIFLIEDDHGIIRATKKMLPHVTVCHISALIK